MAPRAKKTVAAKKKVTAKKASKPRKKAVKAAVLTSESLSTITVNFEALADGYPPEYFMSPSGQWIECFWNPKNKTYDRCHKIDYKDIPRRR